MSKPSKSKKAAGTAVLVAGAMRSVHAAGSDVIKVGLLGCGGRGLGAIRHCLSADPGTKLIACADLFEEKAMRVRQTMSNDPKYKDRVHIKDDYIFHGFDCHEKLAATECDLLVVATPPAFRPREIWAAVNAPKPKHIFVEKPVATDVAGCRRVMEAAKIADRKRLAIVAGTQRRHEFSRIELMKRIHAGQIGELIAGQCYWFGGGIWYRKDSEGMSELEWQCHNWYHFTWLSGDQVVEQAIHNIDMLNWCFNGPPKKFMAIGGRQWRDYAEQAKEVCRKFNNGSDTQWEKYNGNIWDHIFAEVEYPNGARCTVFAGHGPGTSRHGEKIVGTKGTSDCASRIEGENPWQYEGPHVNGQEQEHIDLIQSIRAGRPINHGQRIAESTLTAVGIRTAAYTGRVISWDWLLKASKQELVPPQEKLKPGPGYFEPISTGCDPLV
ncbi:MAG: Gfo/Idh/MocA family oxidoreductase [Verrucomicrobiae bacterium]|nr:Gfo/Idh/MocA family oxidoreductase [Verrucomicrobiae bacterium]